jgi:DNA-binding FrmR family transcriptional regulator
VTGVAADLHEREIVAAGQQLDGAGGDGSLADGADRAARARQNRVQRIHSNGVYPLTERSVAARFELRRIPPGGIIAAMDSDAPARSPKRHAPGADTFRHSYTKDKAQLLRRLARIEGQARGISRMIEREEYCIDILQQTSALRAAVDSLAVLVLEDHVQGCVRTAALEGDADRYVEEVVDVVRRTLGRPTRAASRSS